MQPWNKANHADRTQHLQFVQPLPTNDSTNGSVAKVEEEEMRGTHDGASMVSSDEEAGELRCRKCRGKSFRARGKGAGRELVCESCGIVVEE